MIQLTKRTEYGLIALAHLAGREGSFVSVREVCERYPIPRRFVAEVLKDLLRAGLLDSQRGATGGYSLARPAETVRIGDVVAALEGQPAMTSCGDKGNYVAGDCDVEPLCPIKDPIQRVRREIWSALQRTTLRDLAASPHRTLSGRAV